MPRSRPAQPSCLGARGSWQPCRAAIHWLLPWRPEKRPPQKWWRRRVHKVGLQPRRAVSWLLVAVLGLVLSSFIHEKTDVLTKVPFDQSTRSAGGQGSGHPGAARLLGAARFASVRVCIPLRTNALLDARITWLTLAASGERPAGNDRVLVPVEPSPARPQIYIRRHSR